MNPMGWGVQNKDVGPENTVDGSEIPLFTNGFFL